jgi:hypothetical protein
LQIAVNVDISSSAYVLGFPEFWSFMTTLSPRDVDIQCVRDRLETKGENSYVILARWWRGLVEAAFVSDRTHKTGNIESPEREKRDLENIRLQSTMRMSANYA